MAPNDYDDEIDDEEEDEESDEDAAPAKKKRGSKKWKVRVSAQRILRSRGHLSEVSNRICIRPIAHAIVIYSFQDPNKPKRAMSSFFLYSQANRQRTKEANPTASFGEIVSSSIVLVLL